MRIQQAQKLSATCEDGIPLCRSKIFVRVLKPLNTELPQPIDMELSVGGMLVGGVPTWLQNRNSLRRILHFTLSPTRMKPTFSVSSRHFRSKGPESAFC
jgi:hypothetical protein